MKANVIKILIMTVIIPLLHSLKLMHNYYSLETAEDIDQSQSIQVINKCKAECLQMKDYFPFHFRYHRLIIRQTDGMVKYFIGHCQVKMLKDEYQDWKNLKSYVDSTNLFGEADTLNKGQLTIWNNYNSTCEDQKLQLSPKVMDSMKLTRHHSNFYYYDDGSFKNPEPFDDINSLFSNINGRV